MSCAGVGAAQVSIKIASKALNPTRPARLRAAVVQPRLSALDGFPESRLVSGRIGISTHQYTPASRTEQGGKSAKERSMKRSRTVVLAGGLVASIVALGVGQAALRAAAVPMADAPSFEVDPMWPKPLPNHW